MIYRNVKRIVDQILFQPRFGDEPRHKPIGSFTPLSRYDQDTIKQEIYDKFGLELNRNIADMTAGEICKEVYWFTIKTRIVRLINRNVFLSKLLNRIIGTNETDSVQPTNEQKKKLLNNHEVFAIVLSALRNLTGNQLIFANDRIRLLNDELMKKTGKTIEQALPELLKSSFGEQFEVTLDTSSDPNMAVYNIANQVLYALVDCGKAIDPKVECKGMDRFWVPLRAAMTFRTVVNILYEKFGIHASEKTIAGIKSYKQFDAYVVKLLVKDKFYKIISDCDETVKNEKTSGVLVSEEKAEYITQTVQNVFNITVDYDISGITLNSLCKYVCKKIKNSKESRNMLFGKTGKTPQPTEKPEVTNLDKYGKRFEKRDETFANIICAINRAVSLQRSVQKNVHICNLLKMVQNDNAKTTALMEVLNGLERDYGIDINVKNPNLTIGDICRMVCDVKVERGEAISTYISIDDMDPLWAILNKTLDFNYLKSVLKQEFHINVSAYKMSNCSNYDVWEQLVKNTIKLKEKTNGR